MRDPLYKYHNKASYLESDSLCVSVCPFGVGISRNSLQMNETYISTSKATFNIKIPPITNTRSDQEECSHTRRGTSTHSPSPPFPPSRPPPPTLHTTTPAPHDHKVVFEGTTCVTDRSLSLQTPEDLGKWMRKLPVCSEGWVCCGNIIVTPTSFPFPCDYIPVFFLLKF